MLKLVLESSYRGRTFTVSSQRKTQTVKRSRWTRYVYLWNLLNGVFPDSMKIARVIPLFKTGNTQAFSNYWPISLLPGNLGFRKQMSTSLAIIELVEEITNSLDNHESTVCVFSDLKKAFDTVDHGILIEKLYHYGIRGIANKWICS